MRFPWKMTALLAPLLAFGCSSESVSNDEAAKEGPETGGASNAGGTSAVGGGSTSTGGAAMDPNRPPPKSYLAGDVVETDILVPDIPPGGEATVCVKRRLDNDALLAITEIRGFINEGSHHMIIDRSVGPERLEPYDCGDLQGSDESRMLIAQQKETVFSLPDGVAFSLEAEQTVTVEMHYINTTSETIDASGRVEFQVGDAPADTYTEATMLFTGNYGFSLPPLTQTTVEHFRAVGEGTPMRLFAVTSHTHSLGIHTSIERTTSRDTPGELLHESYDWAEPPLDVFDPPLLFDGTDGLHLACDFDNTRNEAVYFGTHFEDEMCFMWLYLFPDGG